MRKPMTHVDSPSPFSLVLAFVTGMLLTIIGALPSNLLAQILTLIVSGALSGTAGFLAQRLLKNLLHRAKQRKIRLGLLDDPDDKSTL